MTKDDKDYFITNVIIIIGSTLISVQASRTVYKLMWDYSYKDKVEKMIEEKCEVKNAKDL